MHVVACRSIGDSNSLMVRGLPSPNHTPNPSKEAASQASLEESSHYAPRGPILVKFLTPKGGGGTPPSTDPKMVVQNNGFCGRQRFCFRHTAWGNIFI